MLSIVHTRCIGLARSTTQFTLLHRTPFPAWPPRMLTRALAHAATAQDTASFAAKTPAMPTSTMPKRGITLSKLGFGAYRVNDTQDAHRRALKKAVASGVNVIDTSAHFGYGASETFIGKTLKDILSSKPELSREQFVIVSKAGFVLPQTAVFPVDVLGHVPSYAKISDSSYHSIHPTFLKDQITQSLQRLQLDTLDVFLLNHPERMLGDRQAPYGKPKLYKEIAEAFAYLDTEVTAGRIGGYGLCSNALHIPTTEDHLSLKAIINTRVDFGWKLENFVAVQVPMNLFERDVVTDVFPSKSLAREAKEHKIFVFTNRPLNAIGGGQIVTLENKNHLDRMNMNAKLLDTLGLSFQSLAEMELDIKDMIEEESIALKFMWSEILSENLPRLSTNYYAARHYLDKEVLPAIDRDLKVLEDSTSDYAQQDTDDKESVISWIDRYRREARTLVTDIASFCQIDSDKRNDEMNLVLGLVCKDFVSDTGLDAVADIGSPLSVKAIQYCVAHENVGCTLVGMRTPEYVHDAVVAAEASHKLTKEDLKAVAQCPLLLAVNADK
ncbi:MAG: NADP-dependent oxidoreductase domain-containing protein [Podila humilis]|nr:MAG: NADP-dependent oxidoreductase domain-containing protein [Podila humilis]